MGEVFISYAWGGESEMIANTLEQTFQEMGIELVRDKTALGYKDLIKQFMRQIGQGKCVIAIISNKYLKSKNCMFELLEISRNSDFYDRIFPIVLRDARIYDALERLNYIKYWEGKKTELAEAMRELDPANLQGIREEIDLYTDIRGKIASLVDILGNMDTLTSERHRETDFSIVVEAIAKRLNGDVDVQQSTAKDITIGNDSEQNISGNTFIRVQNNDRQSSEKSESKGQAMNREKTSEVDIGIIVALREEFTELYEQLPSSSLTSFQDHDTGVTDYLFEWGTNFTYQCAATFVGDVGLEKAALATERFIQRRQPNTVVMLGIAGGINQDVKLGDVVVVTAANNYSHRGKAVSGGDETFTLEMGGETYRCSEYLARAIQDLEFAHRQLYQEWQEEAKKRREAELKAELLQREWLREKPAYINGAIASGSLVGAAKSFTSWLKKSNRNYLAIEMEGAGMLSAVYSRSGSEKTLILRGISDFADERKQELDQIGKGGIRRYAMNNAIALLWKLLEARILPKNNSFISQTDSSITSYIERPPIEDKCYEEIKKPNALLRLKAPQGFGKTELLTQILKNAEHQGYKKVYLSFRDANHENLSDITLFLPWFCESVSRKLELSNQSPQDLQTIKYPIDCKHYFEQNILNKFNYPFVLGLDAVERIFPYPIATEFLGMLRSWHEEAKTYPNWEKLRLVIAHSTEIYPFINANQSPFNVGIEIELPEFTSEQIQNLARHRKLNWGSTEVEKLMNMVGGHPKLVNLAIEQANIQLKGIEQLLRESANPNGIYHNHLQEIWDNLKQYPELFDAMKRIIKATETIKLEEEVGFKLYSIGLVKFDSAATPRCKLYQDYFYNRLGNL